MEKLKSEIIVKDTQSLFDCYTVMSGTKMTEHERLTFALIADELEKRGVIAWDDEKEEYDVCA